MIWQQQGLWCSSLKHFKGVVERSLMDETKVIQEKRKHAYSTEVC